MLWPLQYSIVLQLWGRLYKVSGGSCSNTSAPVVCKYHFRLWFPFPYTIPILLTFIVSSSQFVFVVCFSFLFIPPPPPPPPRLQQLVVLKLYCTVYYCKVESKDKISFRIFTKCIFLYARNEKSIFRKQNQFSKLFAK